MIRHGYILPLSLMVISVIVIATTYLFDLSLSHNLLMNTLQEREQAKMLALGGLQLAMSQLTVFEKKEEGAPAPLPGQPTQKKAPEQQLFEQIFPIINRWQTFDLTQAQEGIDGTIRICISAEEGKINLAQLLTLAKGSKDAVSKLKELYEPVFKSSDLFKSKENLASALIDALSKRKVPFDDVSQLTQLPEFANIPLFYQPPEPGVTEKRGIYLMDLFTIETETAQLEPWLLSDSVCAVLGLKRTEAVDIEKRKQEIKQTVEKFKPAIKWDKQQWDTLLKPIYGKDFASLPKGIGTLFTAKFEPKIFSVISYGKVGNTVQRIYAVLARSSGPQGIYTYVIRKLYWM